MLTDDISVEEIAEIRAAEAREECIEEVLGLLDQGLSVEEIKQRLTRTTTT